MSNFASEAFQREPRLAGRHGRVRGEPREGEPDGGNPQQGKGEKNVTKYYKISQNVTKCHKMSQNVTKCHKILISSTFTRLANGLVFVAKVYLIYFFNCVKLLVKLNSVLFLPNTV